MKKFKLTKVTMNHCGRTLYRIKALKSFGGISKGDLGGYVEKESNLSHDDNAWVLSDAWVYGNARVHGDALVFGDARVYGNAWVFGNARVHGDALVFGNARVHGDALVFGDARVYGDAKVYGNAWVFGNVEVQGDAWVYGDAKVYGNARLRQYDEINRTNQYFVIQGFKYPITVTYCSIHIGCEDYYLDELDNVSKHEAFSDEEIARIKVIIELSLEQIMEKI